ncbi:FG-GAP repeat domain-containing protein [Streptomyces sp. NPDC093221]|uniref:FG-GAP repeat domain-containing protein n=1 Tax=Streptomyces sp. NPDC093221 TaxID=3366032 RepID=UPI00381FB838
MSEAQPVRFSKRRRLVAVCTTGVLALGALALSTNAQADSGPQHRITRPTAPSGPAPTLTLPKQAKQYSTKAAAGPLRYDPDGDGYADQLYRGNNRHYYNLLTKDNDDDGDLGASSDGTLYKDVLTPGSLDGQGTGILALTNSGRLSYFGAGSFPNGAARWTGTGWYVYNKLVATDDITGDGKPDIVARTPAGQLYLYEGTGNASAPFKGKVLVGSGWNQYDQLTSPGDMNGDGISDLIARKTDGTLYFYAGTGNATGPYAARVAIGTGWNAYNQLVGTGDGSVLARATNGTLYIYRQNGAGGFAPKQGGYKDWNVELFAGAGSNPAYGKKELYGLSTGGTFYWYYTNNNGTLAARQQVSGGSGGYSTFALASSLGDYGYADLLFRDGTNLWNLDSDVSSPLATGWGGYNLFVGPGDLSGDGKGDLLARDTSGNLYLYRGQGTGAALTGRLLVGPGWGAYNAIVGAGDFTGDGLADIVARTGDGTLYLYKGTGVSSRPFETRVKIGTGWNRYNKLASPGDMDGDGRADLLGVDASGNLFSYSSTGTGQFKAPVKQGGGWNGYSRLF